MYRTSIFVIAILIALGTAVAQQDSLDCSKNIPAITGFQQSFPIVTTETIAKGIQCTWTITAKNPHKVLVYLAVNGTATEKQCITVDNNPSSNSKTICGKPEGNTFKSTGHEVTVTFSSATASEAAPNFMVMYQLANSDQCTANPPAAMDSEQSFKIIQSEGQIAQNTHCSWTITTSNPQKIMVRLGAEATDKQCVSVSNNPQKAEKTICGQQTDNTFTSAGQEVTVTYTAPDPATNNFEVFYKSENSKECSTTIPDASAVQQSFPITTTDNIPKGTQCIWTIKAANPQKVLVYLTANGTATETQCITVDNKPPKGSKQICGIQNQNTFTSDGQEMTASYSYNGEGATMPNFMVMYKFANSDACTVTSPMATDSEQSFGIIKTEEIIAANVHCSWTITAPSPKKVMVHLMVEGTSTENQCVSASNNPNEAGQKICGKANENTFTSEGQEVTVTYPASNPASGVKNFKVFYMASGAHRDTAWIAGILPVYILSQLLL